MADSEPRDEDQLDSTVAMTHRCYRESRDHSSEWRIEAPKWYDLVANRQWDKEDIDALEDQDRIPVVINRVARTINAIIGTQVANRQETRFIPRTEGDVEVNEVLTGAADWVRDGCDAEDEESDAFEDTTICGMGWTETRLDYESDPEGATLIERLDPLEMYWDPNAKKRNLADKKWAMRIRGIPIDEFEERWPGKYTSGMLSDPWEGAPTDLKTREHVYPQDAYNNQQPLTQRSKGRKTIRVAQIQWCERVPMYRVGNAAERVSEEAFKKLKDKLEQAGVPYMKQTGIRWKQAFVAGGELLEDGDCPFPDGPTLRCITYKRDRNNNTWYGVVSAMMDPQKYGNKFLSLIMDIIRANAKGGVMMEKDAVDNPQEVEDKWAKPDAIVFLRPGGIAKVTERPKAVLPAGLDRLTAYFLDSVHEVTGINLELLGMANREQAGVLENTRKQAGVTIIAPLFDGLRRYRKEQGRVLLYFIQTYLSDGRLIRITGDNGKQSYTPLVKNPETAKYDVIVDEAPTSPNMKERTFAVLGELVPQLMKAGVPVPPAILKYAPLPSSLIQEWMGYIEQNANQPDPEQLQKMQEEFQKVQQENQDLRLGKEEKMMELELKREEMQQKMQLEREKLAIELQIEQAKAQNSIQIENMKADAQMQIANQKAATDQQMLNQKLDMDRQRNDAEIEAKLSTTEAGMEAAASRVYAKRGGPRKRKVTFARDAKGELAGAEIED